MSNKLNYLLGLNSQVNIKEIECKYDIIVEKIPLCLNCYSDNNEGEYICTLCSMNLCSYHLNFHNKQKHDNNSDNAIRLIKNK